MFHSQRCWILFPSFARCSKPPRRSFVAMRAVPRRFRQLPPSPRLAALAQDTPPRKKIKIIPPPPSIASKAKDPIGYINSIQISELDPRGLRTRLFSRTNPEAAKVGDILLVRQKNGDPFAGVCLSIRRRGVDTAILLRNQLLRTSVEMWFKLYSPNVEGIEVVQRRLKRARRARLYYMRLPKHDQGSVQNIVQQYLKRRAMLGFAEASRKDANSQKKGSNKR